MKLLFTFSLSVISLLGVGQAKQGVVTYESTMKFKIEGLPPEMKDIMPSERKSKNQLLFSETEALYKSLKEEEDMNEELTVGDGNKVRIKMGRGSTEGEVYTNLEDGSVVDKTEFFGRTFLVEGGDPVEWKMTSEMKMIAGYQCMKATYIRDSIPVAVWFTPQIPLSIGPDSYAGLPGLVLSVDVNEGSRTIIATNVEMRPLTADEEIIAPDKGKKVSHEQFKKIRKEKMEEMREMNGARGSGGTFIIRN